MKRRYGSALLSLASILAFLVSPVLAASESSASAQNTVIASALIVPAQVSELGFLISGHARDVSIKEGDSVTAGQTLIVLDTPSLEFAVAEAEADLRYARAQKEIRRNEVIKDFRINYRNFTVTKLRLSVPHEVLDKADAHIERAKASVDIARASMAQGTLVAPHDGVVTSVSVIPAEYVKANQTVVTLATLNDLQLETTDLSERDIPNVRVGAPVNIFVEALNKNINGRVIRISPIADIVGGDVVFKVTIAFDEQPAGLLWGMTAEVEIQSGK